MKINSLFAPQKRQQLIIAISILLYSIPLGYFAFLGFYTRYWADDYCYAALFKSSGFFDAIISSYLTVTMFASNRFSLTLFSGFFELFGINFIRFLPLLIIFFWLASIYLLLSELIKISKLHIPKMQVLIFTSVIVFFSLYLAPNRFQILYWRSGMLPYLAPVILSTLMLFVFLKSLNTNTYRGLYYLFLFFGCFLAGGFSETGITPQIILFSLLLVVSTTNIGGVNNYFVNKTLYSALFSFIGYTLAFILLIISPPNKLRMVNTNQTYELITLITKSFTFALDFVVDIFKSYPLPIFVFFSLFVILGVVFYLENPTIKNPTLVYSIIHSYLFPILISFVLIAASIAPSVFAQSAYPEFRALIVATSILLPLYAFLSWNTGRHFGYILKSKYPKVSSVYLILIFMLSSLYCIKATFNISATYPIFKQRAEQWDGRVALIEQNKKYGILDFQVEGIDSYAGVIELQKDPNFWINICAAETFGVNSLWTDE
ncbi:MAG TPA: DUF6056 family protein [Anaerolineaceae bacterium]|nr:DUF6056 family protein [Anaerolineaceae bacterium]